MARIFLVPCKSCSRHVRVSENVCPFCANAIPEDVRSRPVPRAPRAHLSRAALFAIGAASAALGGAALVGCSTASTGDVQDAAHDGAPDVVQSAYGAPPPDGGDADANDADAPDARDADADVFIVGDAYGGPPPMLDAAYGGPPPDASKD